MTSICEFHVRGLLHGSTGISKSRIGDLAQPGKVGKLKGSIGTVTGGVVDLSYALSHRSGVELVFHLVSTIVVICFGGISVQL